MFKVWHCFRVGSWWNIALISRKRTSALKLKNWWYRNAAEFGACFANRSAVEDILQRPTETTGTLAAVRLNNRSSLRHDVGLIWEWHAASAFADQISAMVISRPACVFFFQEALGSRCTFKCMHIFPALSCQICWKLYDSEVTIRAVYRLALTNAFTHSHILKRFDLAPDVWLQRFDLAADVCLHDG